MNQVNTILIIEDHRETRKELSYLLTEVMGDVNQLEAATLAQARKILFHTTIDLALVDISLPDGNGIDFIHEIHRHSKNTYIVMSTIYDDDEHIFNALRAGANGYLLKGQRRVQLLEQLKGILSGIPPLSAAVAERILDYFHQPELKQVKLETVMSHLTTRETEVLTLLAKGCSRKEVSNLLNISIYTVSDYIKTTYKKLGVHNCAEATLEAVKMGLVIAI